MHLPDPHGIVGISIHALHEESDRISCNACMIFRLTFQSTLSMRRATHPLMVSGSFRSIFQSTLSMRRATQNAEHCRHERQHFNPRSP